MFIHGREFVKNGVICPSKNALCAHFEVYIYIFFQFVMLSVRIL